MAARAPRSCRVRTRSTSDGPSRRTMASAWGSSSSRGRLKGWAYASRARRRASPCAMTHVRPGSSNSEAPTGWPWSSTSRTSSGTAPGGPLDQRGRPSSSASLAGSTAAETPRPTRASSAARALELGGVVLRGGAKPEDELLRVAQGVERARGADGAALLAGQLEGAAEQRAVDAVVARGPRADHHEQLGDGVEDVLPVRLGGRHAL